MPRVTAVIKICSKCNREKRSLTWYKNSVCVPCYRKTKNYKSIPSKEWLLNNKDKVRESTELKIGKNYPNTQKIIKRNSLMFIIYTNPIGVQIN